MSKAFSQKTKSLDVINRNTFDKTYQNNITMRIGEYVPILCRPVIAGESVHIKPSFGLRMMPLAFPTQTQFMLTTRYFYVKNRFLWKGWKEWLAMTDDQRKNVAGSSLRNPEFPWVKLNAGDLKTGRLADFLGVPTTYASVNAQPQTFRPYNLFGDKEDSRSVSTELRQMNDTPLALTSARSNGFMGKRYGEYWNNSYLHGGVYSLGVYLRGCLLGSLGLSCHVKIKTIGLSNGQHTFKIYMFGDGVYIEGSEWTITSQVTDNLLDFNLGAAVRDFNKYIEEHSNQRIQFFIGSESFSGFDVLPTDQNYKSVDSVEFTAVNYAQLVDAVDANVSPFVGDNPDIKVNALPFRAYEACYNAYGRNTLIDPLMLPDEDGNLRAEYDVFCPTGDGKDTYVYAMRHKLWEKDVFTSMLPSPQLGDTPLVGLSTNGDVSDLEFTIRSTPKMAGVDAPNLKEYHFTPKLSDDGEVTGWLFREDDVPTDLKSIITSTKVGYTIGDLRAASALQRYLEARIKGGFRYKDMMETTYGQHVSPALLEIPEFLGGSKDFMNVSEVINQAETADSPLGKRGAVGSFMSDTQPTISCHCDEHGYIIGVACITPVPSYSQLLRKDLTIPSSPLDLYNPAFANMNYQPVRAREITPIQVKAANGKQDEVIGYQRPYYDAIQSLDELHGDLRKDLSGYVVTRIFSGVPRLNKQFVECSANQVTSPFVDTTPDSSIAIGMAYFKYSSKMPMPEFANSWTHII